MPRTRSLAWSELKIGIVSIIAIGMTGLLIFLLSGTAGFSWQRYHLKVVFDNVAGLKEGAPVRVAGVEQGSITGITFAGDNVEVILELRRDIRHLVTTTSVASLGSVSLLGESALDITASSQGTPIPEWGYLKTGKAARSIGGVATEAAEGLQEATKLLQGINKGRGTVGQLLTNDELYVELNQFVSAAEAVFNNVNRGRGTLGRLAQNPAAAKALETSLENLQDITAQLRAGKGSLGQLLNNDTLTKSLTSTTSNLDNLTSRLNHGEGTAGKLLTDASLFNRLNSLSDRLDKVVAELQQGQGTAGQLLHDKQLYENMNSAVTELRNLVSDIRKDPKKYLNMKVSIF
jgi:phospholipid/cholesterol/gamma-HCH transport system substrate-binding protein